MKKTKAFTRVLGIIAMLAVMGFGLIACDDGGGGSSGGDEDLTGTITISPDTDVTTGTELTATYSGSETVTLTYQWKKNGSNIGSNSSTYMPADAGSYTVTVSASGYQSKTSSAVTVTGDTIPSFEGEISITAHADGLFINKELTATYSGSETVTYQWKKDGTVVGINSDKYTPTEAGSYTVTISAEGYVSKTSSAVTVTEPELPALQGNLYIQINSNSVNESTTDTELTATYYGNETGTKSYQWKKDGVDIDSAIYNKYTPPIAGNYTVTINIPGFQSKTSDNSVNVTGDASPILPGTIEIIAKANFATNNPLTTFYTGEPADVNIFVQWKKDGENVNGVQLAGLFTFIPTEPGTYTVSASATGYQSILSDSVEVVAESTLQVNSETVTISAKNKHNVSGSALTLTSTYSGSGTTFYQWKKDGVNIISNATSATYTTSSSQQGNYTVTVYVKDFQSITSDPVEVYSSSTVPPILRGTWHHTGTSSVAGGAQLVFTENSFTPNGNPGGITGTTYPKDGEVKWSAGGFSYVISQDGQTLTISNSGSQVIPNGDYTKVIE